MSEVPNDSTPGGARDGSWPEAAPPPAAPAPPAAPQYPTAAQPGYPQAQYPAQPPQYPGQQPQYPAQPQAQYPAQGYPQQVPQQALASTVQLNYWLSVFFTWIPALIFFVTEKRKNQLADEFHRQNLNFSLLRVICGIGTLIPYLGILFIIAGVILFIVHIMAAASAQSNFNRGMLPKFAFNLNLVK